MGTGLTGAFGTNEMLAFLLFLILILLILGTP